MYLSKLKQNFLNNFRTAHVRHGPFDILGGGGGLGFMSWPEKFFQTISEQGNFFPGPSDGFIFS